MMHSTTNEIQTIHLQSKNASFIAKYLLLIAKWLSLCITFNSLFLKISTAVIHSQLIREIHIHSTNLSITCLAPALPIFIQKVKRIQWKGAYTSLGH